MMNRKGVIPIVVVGWIALALIGIYIILLLPIPAFKFIRGNIELISIFGLWILVQVAIIYAYYYIFKYIFKAVRLFKKYIVKFSVNFKKLVLYD